MIRRTGSISTLKVLSQTVLTSAIFTMSVNMKFACLGRSPTIEEIKALIIPIFKKDGDFNDPNSCRGIALISCLTTLMNV